MTIHATAQLIEPRTHRTTISSFINGRFQPPSGSSPILPVIDPSTEAVVGELVESSTEEVDRAVEEAARAFASGVWSRALIDERQRVLNRIHDLVLANADELIALEGVNTGIPIAQLRGMHLPRTAQNFRFFAEFIGQMADEAYGQERGVSTKVVREPSGVAALIGPWNAPLALNSMKIASALAFGNSCVIKPSEQTPLAVARLVELVAEAGVPEGVIGMVNGRGATVGAGLVANPQIRMVSFTGGTQTGRAILQHAAQSGFKRVALELGGKSANIVCASADFDQALDGSLLAIYANNGQQCLAGSRILLHRSLADRFMEAFAERTRAVRVGDPRDPKTEVGPLASLVHLERVLGFVDQARDSGMRILAGGSRLAWAKRGFYMEPTALLASSNRDRICQDEIFGPVATFLTFNTIEEAVRIANDSVFGLAAYVWSNDLAEVADLTEAIQAGTIWVNTPMVRDLRSAFGGYKESGFGREGGRSALDFYTEAKSVIVARGPRQLPRFGAVKP